MRHPAQSRRGFTLIELLVTMGLIVVLLSIAVAVSNSAAVDSYKLVGSADKVAQALLQSKSRALRDRAPRGVRFNVGADGAIREMVFIESGEPWLPDQAEFLEQAAGATTATVNAPNRSQFVIKFPVVPGTTATYPKPTDAPINYVQCKAYLMLNAVAPPNRSNGSQRGASDYERFNSEVSIGDTLYSPDLGGGVVIQSKAIAPANTLDPNEIPPGFVVIDLGVPSMTYPDLAAGFTNLSDSNAQARIRGTFQTTMFGIYRSPRPIAGEPSLLLGKNVIIDCAASLNGPAPVPNTFFDVLFAPGGQVMNLSSGVVALTVRDSYKFTPTAPAAPANWLADSTGQGTLNFRAAGELILVSIYPKTGTVATKPVQEPTNNAATNDPYRFAKDAINTGL